MSRERIPEEGGEMGVKRVGEGEEERERRREGRRRRRGQLDARDVELVLL